MRMTALKKVIKTQKKCCGTLRMWYLSLMQDTTLASAAEVAEAFLKAIKKDAEMYSSPEKYFMQYLTTTLKHLCFTEEAAMKYIQKSTRWMEQDQERQGR